ncbi:hypothetical protein E5K21_002546 [Enterococcus faecalis]|uniref:hypothetical protein n=1 Tax=Enterococcus faecalis TaxID=1351 RepID=UPI0019E4FCEC|nr:hypothetical protein [Enterococcus faecalis]EGO8197352.1 hypothetical protein [Enterococcus faecalis]MBX8942290.1 hypothetical protein [Enterococcus faecalis]
MFQMLLKRVKELNEQVNMLRNNGEYACSVHLQAGCMGILECLYASGELTIEEKESLIIELQKRENN